MSKPKSQTVFFAILAFALAFGVAVFTLGGEPSHKLSPNDFMSVYNNKQYETLLSKISKQKYTILEGKAEDGVDIFVSYVFNTTLTEDSLVNQRIFSQEPVI